LSAVFDYYYIRASTKYVRQTRVKVDKCNHEKDGMLNGEKKARLRQTTSTHDFDIKLIVLLRNESPICDGLNLEHHPQKVQKENVQIFRKSEK